MIILGCTGSIGVNALKVAKEFNKPIESICAGRNIELLNKQILAFKPKNVCIASECDKGKLVKGDYKLFIGENGILQMLESSTSRLVVNALVGFIGLNPSFKALQLDKHLALANKESLVNAGWLMDMKKITPIDSEHFGLWYLLKNNANFDKLYITASGGALRNAPLESIQNATLEQVLNHPNWQMGQKITIDSASMMNKLFEVLEARWLFDTTSIDAFVESTSSVHAMISFKDGSLLSHISCPDMKLPISYAIDSTLAAKNSFINPLDITKLNISFKEIDTNRYPLWSLKNALLENPKLGVIVNAANEEAIAKFVSGEITFGSIAKIIFKCLDKFSPPQLESIEQIVEFDKLVREFAKGIKL